MQVPASSSSNSSSGAGDNDAISEQKSDVTLDPSVTMTELWPYLSLALYLNVTMLNMSATESVSRHVALELVEPVLSQLQSCEKTIKTRKAFDLMLALVRNSLGHRLCVSESNWSAPELGALLVQVRAFVTAGATTYSDLLKPLLTLMDEPAAMSDKYLPTMEQDNLYDVKVALSTQAHAGGEQARFYTCPNGHIYVIGNCGRPWVTDKCPRCGEQIGGTQHSLVSTNAHIDDIIRDRTMRGYLLEDVDKMTKNTTQAAPTGDAAENTAAVTDLRLLTPAAFHCERFLLHACMYLALSSEEKQADVLALMVYKPSSSTAGGGVDDLREFFWRHMQRDLDALARSLNITGDETLLVLHAIVARFVCATTTKKEPIARAAVTAAAMATSEAATALAQCHRLAQKSERQLWEDAFNKTYVAPVCENVTQVLAECQRCIRETSMRGKDENQSIVYFIAYELLDEDAAVKRDYLYENETFWKYRPVVTYEAMCAELASALVPAKHHKFLRKFVNMVCLLYIYIYIMYSLFSNNL